MNIKEIVTAHFDFSKESLRKFNYLFAFIFALITAYGVYKHVDMGKIYWLGGITMAFLFTGLFVPKASLPLYMIWMGFANILGFIMLHVLFSVLFFCAFLPLKIVFKLTGKKFFESKPEAGVESYWIKKDEKQYNPNHFEKQFS